MNKFVRNGFFKVAGIMLAVMTLAACAVSATLARYYSKGSASGLKAPVATWSIFVGDNDIVTAESPSLEFSYGQFLRWTKAMRKLICLPKKIQSFPVPGATRKSKSKMQAMWLPTLQ